MVSVVGLRIAIVGSGFGMLSVLDRLNFHELRDTTITVFSNDHNGIGNAYRDSPNIFLMNTKTSALTMFDHVISLRKWMGEKTPSQPELPNFLPRSTFGKYLSQVRETLFAQCREKGNRLEFAGPVDKIDQDGLVVQTNGVARHFDIIFLSPGFGGSFDVSEAINQIMNVPQGGELSVVGSGLTGIDATLLAAMLRPDVKIVCVSKSGRFPRIRSDFEVGNENESVFKALLSMPEFTLKEVIYRISQSSKDADDKAFFEGQMSHFDELQLAQEAVSGWQSAAYNATKDYAAVFQRLRPIERKTLMRHRGTFLERRGMYPIDNAKKIISLLGTGQLSMRKAKISSDFLERRETILAFNHSNSLNAMSRRSAFQMLSVGIVACDASGCICPKREIYGIGPITNSVRYFTEASSLTKIHAYSSVDTALQKLRRSRNDAKNFGSTAGVA